MNTKNITISQDKIPIISIDKTPSNFVIPSSRVNKRFSSIEEYSLFIKDKNLHVRDILTYSP